MSEDKQNQAEVKRPLVEKRPEVVRPPAPEAEKQPEAEAPVSVDIEPMATKEGEAPTVKSTPVAPAKVSASAVKDPVLLQVENIMEDDLRDIYAKLPIAIQQEFKQKGEETAGKIQKMIVELKTKAKKILILIRDWLKIIPGVNKFFLEQEAKIKTDQLMALAEQEKEKQKK